MIYEANKNTIIWNAFLKKLEPYIYPGLRSVNVMERGPEDWAKEFDASMKFRPYEVPYRIKKVKDSDRWFKLFITTMLENACTIAWLLDPKGFKMPSAKNFIDKLEVTMEILVGIGYDIGEIDEKEIRKT